MLCDGLCSKKFFWRHVLESWIEFQLDTMVYSSCGLFAVFSDRTQKRPWQCQRAHYLCRSCDSGECTQYSVWDALRESDSTMHVVTLRWWLFLWHVLLARASGVGTSRSGKGPEGLVLWYVNNMRPDSTQDEVVDRGIVLSRGRSHSHDRSVWSDKAIVGPCKWDATNNYGDTVWSYSRLLLTQHGTEGGAAVETAPQPKETRKRVTAVAKVINSHTVDTGRKWSQGSLLVSSKPERNYIIDRAQNSMSPR